MKRYTYDPELLDNEDFNLMRFELGDTDVLNCNSCALCDQEYTAMISKAKATRGSNWWKWAKYECLKAIRMQYAHEVDSSIGGMSLSLSQRYKIWDELYSTLKKELKSGFPTVSKQSLGEGLPNHGHIFTIGMNDNPYTMLGYPQPVKED